MTSHRAHRKIILASSSPRRIEYMKDLGFQFNIVPSRFEEKIVQGQTPRALAIALAKGKAREVASRTKGEAIIIGSDTIVECKGTILGKPTNRADCMRMLHLLSGNVHRVVTAVCIIDTENEKEYSGAMTTHLKMRPLLRSEMLAHARSTEPYDKAGGYALQGKAAIFFEWVRGSHSNVTGFPIPLVLALLKRAGVRRK